MRRCLDVLSVVHLRHPPHTSTSQPWILIAVSPTIHSSLDQASLLTKWWVQLCQGPSDCIAFRLILQPVAPIVLLRTAGPRINTVLGLEILGELIRVHRLHVAAYGVLHLDSITRILERDPLDAILVLPNHERCRCWDWTRCSVGIHSGVGTGWRRKSCAVLRALRRSSSSERARCWRPLSHLRGHRVRLNLHVVRLNFRVPWAPRHTRLSMYMLTCLMAQVMLGIRVGHHHIRL